MLRSKDRVRGRSEDDQPKSGAAAAEERLKPPPPPLSRSAAPGQPEQALARRSSDLLGLNVTPPEPWPSGAAEPRVDDWLPPLPKQRGSQRLSESARPSAAPSRRAATHSQAGGFEAAPDDAAPVKRGPQGASGGEAALQPGAAAEWDAHEPASQTRPSLDARQRLAQGAQPTTERTRTTSRVDMALSQPGAAQSARASGLNAPLLSELLPAPAEPAPRHVHPAPKSRAVPQPTEAAGTEPLARRGRATQSQAGVSFHQAQAVHSTPARRVAPEHARTAESQGNVLEAEPIARRGRASQAPGQSSPQATQMRAGRVELTQPEAEPLARRGRTSRPPHIAQPAPLPAGQAARLTPPPPLAREAQPNAPRTGLQQAHAALRVQAARPESSPALGLTTAQPQSRSSESAQAARPQSRPPQVESRSVETLQTARPPSRPPRVESRAERSRSVETVEAARSQSRPPHVEARPLGIELPVLQPGPGGAGPLRLREDESLSSRSQRAAAHCPEALSGALRFQPQEHTPADGYRLDSRQATEPLPATMARHAPWPRWTKAALAGVALGAAASVATGYSAAWMQLLRSEEHVPVLLTAAPSNVADAPTPTGALAPSAPNVPSLRPLDTSSTSRLSDGTGPAIASPAAESGRPVPPRAQPAASSAERGPSVATSETSVNAATSAAAVASASPEPARPTLQVSAAALSTPERSARAQEERARHANVALPQDGAGHTTAPAEPEQTLSAEAQPRPGGTEQDRAGLADSAETQATDPASRALEAAAQAPTSHAASSSALSTLDDVLTPEHSAPQSAAAPAPTSAPAPERPVLSITPLDPASSGLAAQPSREQVRDVMLAMHSQLAQCARDRHGTSFANVTIQGSGRVSYSLIEGAFAGTEAGSCMARALRDATFPEFAGPPFKVRYPLQF